MNKQIKLTIALLSLFSLVLLYFLFPSPSLAPSQSKSKSIHITQQKQVVPLRPESLLKRAPASFAVPKKKASVREQFNRLQKFLKKKHQKRNRIYKIYVDLKKDDIELMENFDYEHESGFKVARDLRAIDQKLFHPSLGEKILLQSHNIIFRPHKETPPNSSSKAVAVKYVGTTPIFGIINPYLIVRIKEDFYPETVLQEYGLQISHSFDKIRTYSAMLKEDTNNTEKLFTTDAQLKNDPRVLSSKVDVFSAIVTPL